jgi:hypothetical protein
MTLTLIHCSYHKCLTSYYKNYKIASVNNHCIDFSRFDDGSLRLSRFIRDPRDLVISGYFYHKRAAEPWCNVSNPTEADWRVVNGNIPEQLSNGQSYASYLQNVDMEDGLICEIDFRKKHFDGMAQWRDRDSILTIRYEDIIGHEEKVFDRVFSFYEFNKLERMLCHGMPNVTSSRNRS